MGTAAGCADLSAARATVEGTGNVLVSAAGRENSPYFRFIHRLFEKTTERLDALGMTHPDMRDLALDIGFSGLIDKVRE